MTRPEIDRLFTLPLDQFVAERDALAKQLRAAGDKALAAEVKALKKPAAPAWALNQLAREDPKRFAKWLASVDRLRDVQAALALGESDAKAMRQATEAERESIADLRAAADRLLGGETDRGLLERIARTFRAAAMDPENRAPLEAGRLAIEQEEQGFDALAAALVGAEIPRLSRTLSLKKAELRAVPDLPKAEPPPPAKPPAKEESSGKDRDAAARAAAAEAQVFERKIARTETHLAQLKEHHERAKAHAALARAERDRTRRALAQAEQKAEQAEQTVEEAQLDVNEVERDLAEMVSRKRQ